MNRRATEYTASGRWQKAVDLFSHLLERGDDLNIRFRRAGALAEQGRWDEAVADFEHVAGSGNVDFRVWYELAVANLGKGDQQGYRETCAKMLAKFSETTDPLTANSLPGPARCSLSQILTGASSSLWLPCRWPKATRAAPR